MSSKEPASPAPARPPTSSESIHRVEYLPEPVYFHDLLNPSLEGAMKVTAQCVARWATHFLAYPVSDRLPVEKGPLPSDVRARQALIDKMFESAAELAPSQPQPTGQVGLVLHLSRDSEPLFDTYDGGMPRRLFLTPQEFHVLRDCWAQHNLPSDLFYPASERRRVVEPTSAYGGVVLAHREYSPLEWARRQTQVTAVLRIPTEEEREAQFLDALQAFERSLLLRRAEVTEPGKEPDRAVLRELGLLLADLQILRGRAVGADEEVLRGLMRASARAHRRPTK